MLIQHWSYRNISAGVHLFYTIYFCTKLIVRRDTVDEEGYIAPYQNEGEPLEQVSHLCLLLLYHCKAAEGNVQHLLHSENIGYSQREHSSWAK